MICLIVSWNILLTELSRSLWENVDLGRAYRLNATYDLGQDSPIQTDLARLLRCLLYGENKNNLIRLM